MEGYHTKHRFPSTKKIKNVSSFFTHEVISPGKMHRMYDFLDFFFLSLIVLLKTLEKADTLN